MRRSVRAALAAVAITTTLTGCSPEQPAVVVFLGDAGRSTTDPQIREAYLDACRQVSDAVGAGDRFLAARVSGLGDGEVEYLADEVLPTKELLGSTSKTWVDTQQARERIVAGCRELAAAEDADASCIIDAVRVAGRVFGAFPASRPILVLASDMIEHCPTSATARNFYGDPSEPATTVVQNLRAAGRVPDLRGACIHVVGALRTVGYDVSEAMGQWVKEFWFAFLQEAGGRVADHRWGGPLSGFQQNAC